MAFAVLKTIVAESSGREGLALTDLVDALYNGNGLKETDEERSLANQLAFAAFGWISMSNTIPRGVQKNGALNTTDLECSTGPGTFISANLFCPTRAYPYWS